MDRFETPVLFLLFNRPEMTAKTFSAIKQIQPVTLYVSADGPRKDHPTDEYNCAEVRRIIQEGVDWDCDLHMLFRDQNVGCGEAINSGISWFFKDVAEGIIIEDDCLPHQDFFTFCDLLLERYRDDDNVFMISGNSVPKEYGKTLETDYCFTAVPSAWGWATWRRSWEKYDFKLNNLDHFKEKNIIESIFTPKLYRRYWLEYFDEIKRNKINNWDYQLAFTSFNNRGVCIRPKVNLISNLGTTLSNGTVVSTYDDEGLTIVKHPKIVSPDSQADKIIMQTLTSPIHRAKSLLKKLGWFYLIKKVLKKISK